VKSAKSLTQRLVNPTLRDGLGDSIFNLKVQCKFRILSEGDGSSGEILVKDLNKDPCDMVIVGTRGLGTVRRTILGSTSTYLVHHSPVPVLVHRN